MKKNKNTFNRLLIGFTAALLLATTGVYAGQTTRVSASSAGAQAIGDSGEGSISADGRYVTFTSDAGNLVNWDTNGLSDVFVRDRVAGTTKRMSVSSTGAQGTGGSRGSAISADGRYVVFTSDAGNLVAGDTNGQSDVFVRDRATSQTTRISVSSGGTQGNAQSNSPVISADGRYVAFTSDAGNLVAGDTNGLSDVFVRDRVTSQTTRFSVNTGGVQRSHWSQADAISADGRFVVFTSETDDFGDLNDYGYATRIFVRDRVTNTTTPVSVSPDTDYLVWFSNGGRISADGRYVAYRSTNREHDLGNTTWLHDRKTGTTTLIGSRGGAHSSNSYPNAISADGYYVAFTSNLRLVSEGECEFDQDDDVFLYERETRKITGISKITGDELCGPPGSRAPAVSADGRYVAFTSYADSLVTGDTNYNDDVFVRDRLLSSTTAADLQATVTAKPASVRKGQTASYRLTVKNNGPNSAGNVALTDIVSNGTVLTITPSQGTCSKAAISVCRLGTLAAGASATVAVTIRADASSLRQKISVSATPKDNAVSNNTVWISTPVIIP